MTVLLQQFGNIKWQFCVAVLLTATSFLCWSTNPFASIASFAFGIFFAYFGYLEILKVSPNGKAVLITGCDTGFGHQLALRLNAIGFRVFAGCLNDEGEGAHRLKKANDGSRALHVIRLDVTKDEDVLRAQEYVLKHLGDTVLWGIVNNAGICANTILTESKSLDSFIKVLTVNLMGVVRVTKAFLPYIRINRGRIVNVSSLMGRFALPGNADYTIAKYGVEAFSDTLRRELRQIGVKVCVIQPGNFIGATSIVSRNNLSQYTMRQFWNLMDDEARQDYGIEIIARFEKNFALLMSQSLSTMTPVVDAMTAALCQVHPKTHYVVAQLSYRLGIYLSEILPAWIVDVAYKMVI